MISVFSYNILEESLAQPSFFSVTDPSYLETDIRIPKIVLKLKQAMSSRSIITLQEVGVGMASKLHEHFIENGYYTVVAHSFMGKGRNFQGVLIAYPTNKYKYISYNQVRIGGLISEPEGMINHSVNPRDVKAMNAFSYASIGDQCLLSLILEERETQKRFTVMNYHMPCVYWWPAIMTLHVEAICKMIRGPCILLGDFNFTPRDSSYRQITGDNRSLDLPCENYKLDLIKLIDCCTTESPTTRALSPQGRDFCERLDYIFHTEDLICEKYYCEEITMPLPNEHHGSDHVPISAVLRLI